MIVISIFILIVVYYLAKENKIWSWRTNLISTASTMRTLTNRWRLSLSESGVICLVMLMISNVIIKWKRTAIKPIKTYFLFATVKRHPSSPILLWRRSVHSFAYIFLWLLKRNPISNDFLAFTRSFFTPMNVFPWSITIRVSLIVTSIGTSSRYYIRAHRVELLCKFQRQWEMLCNYAMKC